MTGWLPVGNNCGLEYGKSIVLLGMAVMPLRDYPAVVLRTTAAPVDPKRAADFQPLLLAMIETMVSANGIGLAATQVGRLHRVIVVRSSDGPLGLLNPEIVDASSSQAAEEEGCLSLPGVFGFLKRAVRVKVSAWSAAGEPLAFAADGLLARVLQHEIDHLNGILFIDRMHKLSSGADRLRELWRAAGQL